MGGDKAGLGAGLKEGIERDIFPFIEGGLRVGDIVASFVKTSFTCSSVF